MSISYEEKYGKLELPLRDRDNNEFKQNALIIHHNAYDENDIRNNYDDNLSVHPTRAFAEIYKQPVVRSVLTAEQFMRWSKRDHRGEEANLWNLLLELLLDAEQGNKYNPDAIGISEVQPHRRWYISHLAHIQDLLLRYPILRRMNIVMRWLERTYREGNTPLKLYASQSPEEAVLLRQIILSHLRGGELYRAIDLAITAKDCTYSCILSAAQMQTVRENWSQLTAYVPLFGEYENGETNQTWVGNEHRLDNLSQLYEDSVTLSTSDKGKSTLGGLDAVIAAVLCGNLEVMEPAFVAAGNWKDTLWCHLRAALVLCFTKTLMVSNHPVQAEYANLVEKFTGSHDNWQDETARGVVQRLSDRLQSTYLTNVSLEEQLQIRVILQFLSSDGIDWMNIKVDSYNKYRDDSRLISHLLLCLDTAYNETLHSHSVQVYSNTLATSLAQYAQCLAQIPNYSTQDAMRLVIAMNLHLRDAQQRASVYAAFLMACRRRELESLNREDVELHEAKLIQLFCEADRDDTVHDEVMRLLNQKTEPAALLTHNPIAEKVMWRAMHADSLKDFTVALHEALEACAAFWLAEPQAELDAIADVASVLRRFILPNLQNANQSQSTQVDVTGAAITEGEELSLAEAHFWILFSRCHHTADEHLRSTAQLDVARAGVDKTLVFQLEQEEAALMQRLHAGTQQALGYGGALVRRCRGCVTAISWLVQLYTEGATLSLRLAAPTSNTPTELLRHVFTLVQYLDTLGYIEPKLLPQQSAKGLFDAVRGVRMAYGQKAHNLLVEEARRTARVTK